MGSSSIAEIAAYHNDVVDSLKAYFFGRRPGDLAARLEETDLRSAFFVLTTLEAAFRVDYMYRCQKKKRDDLSRAFRDIYKDRERDARLDEDIFETWKDKSSAPAPRLIGELRGAFRFRHWLAHGRYYEPKLGRKYDFNFIYSLADDVLNAFPLLKFD